MSDNQIVEKRDQVLLTDGEESEGFENICDDWDDFGNDTDEYYVKNVEAPKVEEIDNSYSVE